MPPTFAALFAVTRAGGYVFDDPELGASARLMHGNQEFDFHRPVRPGDVLECRPRITRILSRRGSEFLTLQVDCVDAGTGEPVVTSRQTVVFLPGRDS
ncbi:MAG: MaoC family dehydratase N-terminal domain-containing protein [Actinomycetota bacterium]|nr:MaoC family dehydratase N-terminal domain-containing protein [Actinomycetota bacterium]